MITIPTLKTGNYEIDHAFRIAVGDLAGNIQNYQGGLLEKAEPCLMAGMDYNTPWTRDAAINTWYGLGLLAPEIAKNTLLSVLERRNQTVQIGGQYWDAIVWVTGAWQAYLYSGDKSLLALTYVAARNSIQFFEETEYDLKDGLFRGGGCFQDGVAAYPDAFIMPDYQSGILSWVDHFPDKKSIPGYGLPMKALSTNCLYYSAYNILWEMAAELGWTAPTNWRGKAEALKDAINKSFWDESNKKYRYLIDVEDTQEREEGFGNAFALIFGVATPEQSEQVIKNQTITAHGIPCIWPSYERYNSPDGLSFGRHSGTIWPQVNAAWADALVVHGHREMAYRETESLAKKACRDMQFVEIYHPIHGAPYGGLQENPKERKIVTWEACNRQSWCASGFIFMVLKTFFGMNFSKEGIDFHPYLPESVDSIELQNLPYRRANLNIRIERRSSKTEVSIPAESEGNLFIEIS